MGIWRTIYDKFAAQANPIMAALTLLIAGVMVFQYWYQKDSTDRVWSAQQVATIYEEECDGIVCKVKASPRSREVAVRWYVTIEGHDGEARLPTATLDGLTLSHMDLSGVDFSGSTLQGSILTGANLEGAKLANVSFDYAELTDAKLGEADLNEAILKGARLTRADLTGAILEKAVLGECLEPKRDFNSGDSISTAVLSETKVNGARMTGASLCGVDLTGTLGLEQWQIDAADGDDETRLLPGLVRPKSWSRRRP